MGQKGVSVRPASIGKFVSKLSLLLAILPAGAQIITTAAGSSPEGLRY